LIQQAADDEHPEADELEEGVDPEFAEDGALNEGRKGDDSDHELSEEEEAEIEGSISAEEEVEEEEQLRKADAEASEKRGKKVNISCTYTEEEEEEAKAKASSLAKDKKSKRKASLSAEGRARKSRSFSGSVDRRRKSKSPKESCSTSPKGKKQPTLRRNKKEDKRRPVKKEEEYFPTLEGEFVFEHLKEHGNYVLTINEYNDIGKKCKYVGGFYNPRNLKKAPGVKAFKADEDGKFEKSFKNLPLSITGRDSIINRSCVLKKVKVESDHSDSDDDHRKKKRDDFTKCAVITWEAPFWASGVTGYE